jgi:hypothetical protein
MFCKVFVDIPPIDSLEKYSPLLLTGDASREPISVVAKMAQMEAELTALQRAHEALRKYVLSVFPLPHSAADTVTHPTTNSLAQITAAPTDVEMVPADDILAPATAEEPQADLPMELAPADGKQQPSLEQADVTAAAPTAAPNLNVERRQAGIAVEEVNAACERRPVDVDRDGEQADAGVSTSAATGGAQGSLEDGEIPEV